MLSFLFRKMWKRRWLVLCLLMGNILLVGTVAATPMFNTATMTRILRREMRNLQITQNRFPAVVEFNYAFNQIEESIRISGYESNRDLWVPLMLYEIGIPIYREIRADRMGRWTFTPTIPREIHPRTRNTHLVALSDMTDLITLTYGRLPSPDLVNGNTIEVLASEIMLFSQDMLTDELFLVRDVHVDYPERHLYIRVVGMFEPAEGAELIWSTLHISHRNTLLIHDALVHSHFIPNYHSDYRLTTQFLFALNTNTMTGTRIPHYLAALETQHGRFGTFFDENFSDRLVQHSRQAGRLSTTLLVLQLPIFIMLALYIYMVSRQILQLEQNDISVIKSRGASRGQILGLYVMQGLFIAGVTLPAGLALGVGICRLLGASNGFMELVQRAPLQVEITGEVMAYAGAALLFSFLAMLVPVIRFSKVTIVTHKLTKSGKPRKPLWQRYFLDVLCFAVSLYVIYNFNLYQDQITELASAERGFDPLLLLGSSLFIIGLGLLCLRIFPYVVRGIFWLGRRLWSPSVYASLLKVIRSAGEEQFIMIFLVFTLAVGIFSAQAARTLNLNYEHEIRYVTGADIVFQEQWLDNTFINENGVRSLPVGASHVYREPSFGRFTHFQEVASLTPILRSNTEAVSRGVTKQTQFMGIETNTFGETVWFRDDLLQVHLNHYLNTLALHPNGVLLSANFREYGLEIGDNFRVTSPQHPLRPPVSLPLVIVGFFEHWPGFPQVELRRLGTGYYIAEARFLAVANLPQVSNVWGLLPYQVWMRTYASSGSFFYEFVNENRLSLSMLHSVPSALIEMRTSPMVQGTNGVLTVNFLITLLICFSGFLIYWILSIRSRVLQFGIFRAMGMSMGGIVRLLINEQIFITLTALGIGAVVGEVAARHFVPLIQLSYAAAQRPIPLLIVVEMRDYINLYAVMGVMIVLCLGVLLALVTRMKVAQILKLGED
ncbi:MAG: ABC transporter permease [Defluviitaleaceae bacterium]|nr:ABC transporter permease [Defluviitaleaceae bacterium]MCL2239103.1 ABC transporter permease [Defluviitaleaceae bacterium]